MYLIDLSVCVFCFCLFSFIIIIMLFFFLCRDAVEFTMEGLDLHGQSIPIESSQSKAVIKTVSILKLCLFFFFFISFYRKTSCQVSNFPFTLLVCSVFCSK